MDRKTLNKYRDNVIIYLGKERNGVFMGRKIFYNALLIDGTGSEPINNGSMLIEDDRIAAVGHMDDFTSLPDDVERIDCSGKTLMPGMINTHVNLFMEPYTWNRMAVINMPISRICVNISNNLKKTLKSGVTFCRDVGGMKHLDIEFRGYIEEGLVIGPNYQAAASPLCIPGGYWWWFSKECDGAQKFAEGVLEQIQLGADFITILPTEGYARPKMQVNHVLMEDTLLMTDEEIKASVDAAHMMGKKVIALCNGFSGVSHSVNNGVDAIHHGQFYGIGKAELEPVLEKMVNEGIWLIPTLAAFFKEYSREEIENNYQPIIEAFNLYREAGVKIAMGTDAGVPWVGHEKAAKEVEHMSLYGMTNMEAIVAATGDAAKAIDIYDNFGTLEKGKYADFLVLNNNPLIDIKALQNDLNSVYKSGYLVE